MICFYFSGLNLSRNAPVKIFQAHGQSAHPNCGDAGETEARDLRRQGFDIIRHRSCALGDDGLPRQKSVGIGWPSPETRLLAWSHENRMHTQGQSQVFSAPQAYTSSRP